MPPGRTYEEVVAAFRWRIPERFNIGIACSDEQVADDPAVIEYDAAGAHRVRTFAELAEASNRLANALVALGVARGERVGLLVPQSFATAVAHLAIHKAGAVALPLSELFGPDALRHRLADSGARVLIVAARPRRRRSPSSRPSSASRSSSTARRRRRIAASTICFATARPPRPASGRPRTTRRS